MYRGRIPHKWNRDRYDPEYMCPAPYTPEEHGSPTETPPEEKPVEFPHFTQESLAALTKASIIEEAALPAFEEEAEIPAEVSPEEIAAEETMPEETTVEEEALHEETAFPEEAAQSAETPPEEPSAEYPRFTYELSAPAETTFIAEEATSAEAPPEYPRFTYEEAVVMEAPLTEEEAPPAEAPPIEEEAPPAELLPEDIAAEYPRFPYEEAAAVEAPLTEEEAPPAEAQPIEEDTTPAELLPEDIAAEFPRFAYEEPAPAEAPPTEEEALTAETSPIAEEELPGERPSIEEEAVPAETFQAAQTQKIAATLAGRETPRQAQPAATAQGGLISGRNAVLEALRSGETINRVLLAEGQGGPSINEVIKRCRESGIPYQFLPKARLIKIAGADHRGVVCELSPFRYAEVEDMLQAAQHKGEPPLLVLLDGVEDPHNLGAVMRTALCAGAHGIIIPKRRSASFTATVSKTSAGASAYMPLARVSNLTQTARLLQQAGLWLAAADMDGQTAWQADLNGPLALVLGGEGEGVSQLLKRQCDMCISLPMSGPVASLNVSAAASALLYEIRRQRAGE